MWCPNPDIAFDLGCSNLTCEDWCNDHSQCPIQRKDKSMYILVKNEIDVSNLDGSKIVIHLSKDGKKFAVLKHANFPKAEGEEYHISYLRNILSSGIS